MSVSAATFASAARHPLPEGRVFGYGTAGFRTDASILDGILYRVGLLASLRARQVKQYVGVMLTASHNPHQDNGVKIIDNNGEMLDHHWEPYATQIANARTAEDLASVVNEIISKESVDMSEATSAFQVIVARDTRPSGTALRDSCQDGIHDLGQKMIDVGLTTTPEAHFIVMKANEGVLEPTNKDQVAKAYIDHLTAAFKRFTFGSADREENLNVTLIIDCANGVGTLRFPQLSENLKNVFAFDGRNTKLEEPTLLNEKSGADFVQKELVSPTCISAEDADKAPKPQRRFLHFVSWDGDVDRVVFFFFNDEGQFQLVDGDKMLTLFASFFKLQFDALQGVLDSSLTIGTVQTAYANGGSTQYLQNVLKVPVACVPTGVKYLHHQAKEYDIGVYFEANGHGTVLFSTKFRAALAQALENPSLTDAQRTAAQRLQGAAELLHPTVGDAIADMLAIEGCLALLELDLEKWNSVYSDLPSRQLKAAVPDPKVVKTVWDETRVLEPAALQEDIDGLVKQYTNARAFVRPSGTEPIVRVYAEAATRAEADLLAQKVQEAIVARVQ